MSLVRLSERVASHSYTIDGEHRVVHYLWCPGCEDVHAIDVVGSRAWQWDGDAEAPTYSPSLLTSYGSVAGQPRLCHSFIVAGQWQFLGDSTHALAGQTVPMVPYPEEYL